MAAADYYEPEFINTSDLYECEYGPGLRIATAYSDADARLIRAYIPNTKDFTPDSPFVYYAEYKPVELKIYELPQPEPVLRVRLRNLKSPLPLADRTLAQVLFPPKLQIVKGAEEMSVPLQFFLSKAIECVRRVRNRLCGGAKNFGIRGLITQLEYEVSRLKEAV